MPKTILRYSRDTRLWLKGNGFSQLQEAVHDLCEKIYPMSCRLTPPFDPAWEYVYYDINSSVQFRLYETDTYPPDGFQSLFFSPTDYIPSPLGNLGSRPGQTFERQVKVCAGAIVYNPKHIKSGSERSRPSTFREDWGIELKHHFEAGEPTNRFEFDLPIRALAYPLGYQTNYKGFFESLNSKGVEPVLFQDLPRYPEYNRIKSKIIPTSIATENGYLMQRFDEAQKRWRGFIVATLWKGIFFQKGKEIFLE